MLKWTTGALVSSWTTSVRPLRSTYFVYGMSMREARQRPGGAALLAGVDAGAGRPPRLAGRVRRSTEPCRPVV